MQIDWTTISVLVIGFLAINGFFRGWWREAFTTAALTFLLVLLQQPTWAAQLISLVNSGLAAVGQVVSDVAGSTLPFDAGSLQLNPEDPATWLVILFLSVGVAGILSRLLLPGAASKMPGQYYSASLTGKLLGFGLGGVNGFLLLNLIREYLDGRSLPGSDAATAAATADIVVVGAGAFGQPASSVSIEAVGLPDFTILDNIIPWVVVGGGMLVLLSILKTRVGLLGTRQEGWKIATRPPYGYNRIDVKPPPTLPPRQG